MSGPYVAVSVFLLGFAGLFALVTASLWLKASQGRERSDKRPAIPVHAFRSAASATAVTLFTLGLALVWVAFVCLDPLQ